MARMAPPVDEIDQAVLVADYRITWAMRLPYPVRTMLHRWRGMIGMVLGVGIALSLAMTMIAVSKASLDLFTSDYIASGVDLYAITNGGKLIALLPGDTPGTIKQGRRELTQVRALPNVNAAIGVMTATLERQQERQRRSSDAPAELVAAIGVDGDPTAIPDMLLLKDGRWLRRSNEIVLGAKYAREKGLRVGDTLRLAERDFSIAGIGRLRGLGGFGADSLVYLDYGAFRERTGIGDIFSIIAIDTPQPAAVRARLAEVSTLTAFTPSELVVLAEQANASSVAIRWIFSLLALGIGALFVSNMLSRSVMERRLEFATLRAIGLPSSTILSLVALEAIIISLTSSLVGIGLSLIFGWLINVYVAAPFGVDNLYSADAGSFGFVFVLAMGLGLIAGLMPARNATRVDPVEILREA